MGTPFFDTSLLYSNFSASFRRGAPFQPQRLHSAEKSPVAGSAKAVAYDPIPAAKYRDGQLGRNGTWVMPRNEQSESRPHEGTDFRWIELLLIH